MIRAGRVAAIYDVHGNLPALEAVLDDVKTAGADLVVVGGDVLPGPMPRESLDLLRRLPVPAHFILGNGDAAVLDALAGRPLDYLPGQASEAVIWTASQLREGDERLLSDWPATLSVEIHGLGHVLFCHATPRSHTEIFTLLTPEDRLLPVFQDVEAGLVVCGHTHMPFDRMVGATRVVNAGSAGMPFGRPGADWLLLGPGVEPRHTDYDLAAAAGRIRRTSLPRVETFVVQNVLSVPSEREMLALYARKEIRAE